MRFIFLAIALLGAALFISSPQVFGNKKKFQLSDNGRVVRPEPNKTGFDFSKIGDFGVEMYKKFTTTHDDSGSIDTTTEPETAIGSAESQVNNTQNAPDLSTYNGQVLAISLAMQNDLEAATSQMKIAMQACLTTQSPEQLTNYFVGLVQVVAETSQLPQAQQADNFRLKNAPLTQALAGWLRFMPEDQRAAHTLVLQNWAAQPKALVACNLAWLTAN